MSKKTPLHGRTLAAMVERMMKPQHAPKAVNAKLAAAAGAVLQLEKLAANRNPMETDAAHAKRVASAAGQLKAKIARLEGELAEETQRQRERLNREIQEKARLAPSQHAAEIRAALRAADEKTRLKVARDALAEPESGAEILAAIAEGNSVTTGLSDATRRQFVELFQKTQAPELFEELSAMDEILEHAPQIVGIAKQASAEAVNPAYIEEISAAEKAAQEAQDAFSQSVA